MHIASAGGRGHVQRGHDQAGIVVGVHRVAEQAAREQVDDRRQVNLALASVDLGHIAYPDLVRFRCCEVALHQIWGGRATALPGQAPEVSYHPGEQAEFGHHLGDGVHRYPPAGTHQQHEALRRAVGTAGVFEDRPDLLLKPCPSQLTWSGRTSAPLVEPRGGDAHRSAGHRVRDVVLGLAVADHPGHLGRVCHSYFTHKSRVGPGRGAGLATSPFPRAALRTRRARSRATGAPQAPVGRRSSAGAGPRGGDLQPSVEVADGLHPGGVEQPHLLRDGPPAAPAVAAAQVLPGAPGGTSFAAT